jgi:hypothetical protein
VVSDAQYGTFVVKYNKEQLAPQEWEQRNKKYKCFQELVAVYKTSDDGENG